MKTTHEDYNENIIVTHNCNDSYTRLALLKTMECCEHLREKDPDRYYQHLSRHMFNDYGVIVTLYPEKHQRCMHFGYHQFSSVKQHPVVDECRGLILSMDDDFKVLARPFNRFYNYQENGICNNTSLNNLIDNAYLPLRYNRSNDGVETAKSILRFGKKLDGTFIILWFNPYSDKWEVGGRNRAFMTGPINEQSTISFTKWFYYTLGTIDINCFNTIGLKKDYTYMFELTSPNNKLVTTYMDNRVTFLGMRENKTGYEPFYNDAWNHVKYILGVFNIHKLEEPECISVLYNTSIRWVVGRKLKNALLDMMKRIVYTSDWFEGIVIHDQHTGERLKFKNKKYVDMSTIKNNGKITIERAMDIIDSGEVDEFITYFPEHKQFIENIGIFLDTVMIEHVWNKTIAAFNIPTRKEQAEYLKDFYLKDMVFSVLTEMNKHKYNNDSISRIEADNVVKQIIYPIWKNKTQPFKEKIITKWLNALDSSK